MKEIGIMTFLSLAGFGMLGLLAGPFMHQENCVNASKDLPKESRTEFLKVCLNED